MIDLWYVPFPWAVIQNKQSMAQNESQTLFLTSALCNYILTSMREAVPHFESVRNIGQTPKHLYAHTPQCEITLGYSPVKVCSFSVFGTTDLKPIPYGQY